jgi:hypothetical protein
LPPSADEWLREKHLARFIGEVIDDLDLGRMSRAYRGTEANVRPRPRLTGTGRAPDAQTNRKWRPPTLLGLERGPIESMKPERAIRT